MGQDLHFYTNPMSRGQIARWALEEMADGYQEHIIAYGEEMKGERYRAINPMGKVPAIRHGDRVVTEAAAICAYLADAFPDAKLGPNKDERADYYRWFFFAAGPLESAITNRSMGWTPDDEQSRMAGYGSYDMAVDVLASHLADRHYVCGDRFTAVDIYVGSHVDWGVQFKTLPERQEFVAYAERLQARDGYKRAKERDGALIAAMQNDD